MYRIDAKSLKVQLFRGILICTPLFTSPSMSPPCHPMPAGGLPGHLQIIENLQEGCPWYGRQPPAHRYMRRKVSSSGLLFWAFRPVQPDLGPMTRLAGNRQLRPHGFGALVHHVQPIVAGRAGLANVETGSQHASS